MRHILFANERYKKSLEQTLAQMPFIYKDVDLEVLQDYVDIEVQFVDTKNLKPLHIIKAAKPLEKLNQNFKALFIGSAGMGKSTFFRFSALSTIKRLDRYFLISLKGQTPIFVSLKTVPNFGKSPIIRFLLSEVSFLKNDGVAKLLKLTAKGKVYFLLDGYDEISFINSKNHMQYELGLLLSTTLERDLNPDMIDPVYTQIYRNLTRCNVWLSTREEFYRLNPIGITNQQKNDRDLPGNNKDFIAVQLRGLGDNRLVLVKKIFDKYRAKSKRLAEILDEEIFIEEIDTHEDEEMVKLSKRPLFLTILCYIHVNYLIDHEGEDRIWLPYLHELVLECVKVLLSDLDKFKVRHYSVEQKRIAFVNRRSGYTDEKTAFLKYFCFELMLAGENTFDFNTLVKHVKIYFGMSSDREIANTILSELDSPRSNNPNFAVQLIFSGVFVVVNSNQDHLLYDFPHRRFKEVLATEALRGEKTFKHFLTKLTDRNLSEFVLFAFKQLKSSRDTIMKKLFETWQAEDDLQYRSQLILNLIYQNPAFKIDPYMLTNIKAALTKNVFLTIYLEMLETIKGSYSAIESLLLSDIIDAIQKKKLHTIEALLELAEVVAPEELRKTLDNEVFSDNELEIKVICLKFKIKQYLNDFNVLDPIYSLYADEVSLTAISTIRHQRFNEPFYAKYFECLPIEKFLLFWHLLSLNNDKFSTGRKSSMFDNYEGIYKKFQDSTSIEQFRNPLLKSIETALFKFEQIVLQSKKNDNPEELSNLKNEISGLQTLIKKINSLSEAVFFILKKDIARLDRADFSYLKDRIDKRTFYRSQDDV